MLHREIRTVSAADDLEGYLRQYSESDTRHNYDIEIVAGNGSDIIGYAVTPEMYRILAHRGQTGKTTDELEEEVAALKQTILKMGEDHQKLMREIDRKDAHIVSLEEWLARRQADVSRLTTQLNRADDTICYMAVAMGRPRIQVDGSLSPSDITNLMEGH